MDYITTSFFDRKSWDKLGISWMESAKAENLTGFIVGLDIPDSSRYLKQMGFSLVAITDKSVVAEAIVSNLDKNQSCLFTHSSVLPKGDLCKNTSIKCKKKIIDIFEITSSIQNLFERTKAINSLKEVQNKYNSLLSSDIIFGDWAFWVNYSGFQRYLYDINYLNQHSSPDLIFNLYISLVKPNELGIV